MKIDLYTKTVLTVIAACLLTIVARDLSIVGVAQAQMKPPKGPVYDANGSLNVRIVNAPLKVTIGE